MLIVLSLYAGLIYLIFVRFRLLPWTLPWKALVSLVGVVIALTVIGALNYLTPAGRVAVQGASIEITPNVAGTVVEVRAVSHQQMQKGDLLFRIDPTPFATEVARLEAALVSATSTARGLQAEMDTALAEIERLNAQLTFGLERRDDIIELAQRGATNEFQMQEAVSNIEQLRASLHAAESRRDGVQIRIDAQVNGVNAAVVQAEQALSAARWNLAQTEILAPADGIITALSLRPGQRVTPFQPAIAYVPDEDRALVGVFRQTAADAFQLGTEVNVALQAMPGTSFRTHIDALVPGTAEGTLGGATGALPSVSQLLGSDLMVVRLAIPEDLPDHAKVLGMSGTAMVITDRAGPVEPLAKVLFWLQKMLNYL